MNLRIVISSTNKNRAKNLVNQLTHLNNNLEIIVILQSSYLSHYKNNVKIINFDKNIGLSKARNCGAFYEGTYNYCIFLDDDISIPCDFINKITEVINDFSPDMIAGCLYQDENLAPYHKNSVTDENHKINYESKYIFGALLIIKKDTFVKLNGFDERFGVGSKYGGGEDADILYRINKLGLKVLRDPRVYCYHKSFINEYALFDGYKKSFNNGYGSGALFIKQLLFEKNYKATLKIFFEIIASFSAIFYYLLKINFRMSLHHLISQIGKVLGASEFILNSITIKIIRND